LRKAAPLPIAAAVAVETSGPTPVECDEMERRLAQINAD